MRRATITLLKMLLAGLISIHALREESDFSNTRVECTTQHFNPRSPWGERLCEPAFRRLLRYFNPRSPWGERLFLLWNCYNSKLYFNPRSPWGERQMSKTIITIDGVISIHALREESDKSTDSRRVYNENFNPRSPWGERQNSWAVHRLDW